MKTIGIKQADGSFYPILEEGQPSKKTIDLVTAKDNQTRVIVDLYRSKTDTMEDAEYVDSLQIDNLIAHAKGHSEIKLNIGIDEDGKLSAELIDPETGASSSADVTLVNRTLEERLQPTHYDVKFDELKDSATDISLDEPSIDEPVVEEPIESSDSDLDMSFDLPDFDIGEDSNISNAIDSNNFEMPSFSGDPATIEDTIEDPFSDNNFMDSFEDATDEKPAPDSTAEMIKHSSALKFNDLYDKETMEGDSSVSDEEEEVEKEQKIPTIICIICAIICIIAVILLLFVLPSKFNLLKKCDKKETTNVVEKVITEEPKKEEPAPIIETAPEPIPEPELESIPEPEPTPEPEIIEAKEDEIIVVEEPELVVPEPPKEPEVKVEDIIYKIKWGDTLWDIADAYYKNPWKYKKIAKYNDIKNPDYIISGHTIKIPAN